MDRSGPPTTDLQSRPRLCLNIPLRSIQSDTDAEATCLRAHEQKQGANDHASGAPIWQAHDMPEGYGLDQPFKGVGTDMVAKAAVGFVVAGPVGAAAGAVEPWITRAFALSQRELTSRQPRAVAMWQIASVRSQCPPDELLDHANDHPDKTHLAFTAAEAAGESRYPERIRALGNALAAGLMTTDDAVLDHEQLVVDSLAAIERPHLVLMWAMISDQSTPDFQSWVPLQFDWQELCSLASSYRRSLAKLLAVLVREGLVEMESVSYTAASDGRPSDDPHIGHFWRLSDFGREVLARLWKEGLRSTSDQLDGDA